MASWNPKQYATFLDWRTRPALDLAQRINIRSPRKIIDLGCGPGNSTAVCAERWPEASIVGLDSSPEMIAAARASQPERSWMVGDIGEWIRNSSTPEGGIDLIFSSAALQWIDDHETVFPALLEKLSHGGVLAAQMPAYDAIPNRLMRDLAGTPRWRKWFREGRSKEWRSHPLDFYYRVLAPKAKSLDLWATEYLQVMPDVNGIVEWYKSTGLRPYLEAIQDSGQRQEFLLNTNPSLKRSIPNRKRVAFRSLSVDCS